MQKTILNFQITIIMEIILIFLFIMQICHPMHSCIGVPDVSMIYNMRTIPEEEGERFPVDVEIHSLSYSLGKIFHLDNKTQLFPTSSGAFPHFTCINSEEPCQWSWSGSWKSSSLDISEEAKKLISIPHDINLLCEYNNGGCQVTCTNSVHGPRCSCPVGFSLNSDNKTCSTTTYCYYILNGDHGSFETPHYSSNYPNHSDCKWLIVTSRGKTIRLSIPIFRTEAHHDRLTIFDGTVRVFGIWSGSYYNIYVQSTGNIMLVHFTSDHSVTNSGFAATYNTEINTDFQLQAMQMNSDSGNITTFLNLSSSTLCVSAIYSLESSGSMNITIDQSSGERTNLTQSQIHPKIDVWFISRFTLQNYLNMTDRNMNLTLHFDGKNSKVLNIAECTTEESDVYILPSQTWTRNNLPKLAEGNTDNNKKCYNGGTFISTLNSCMCPAGFTGDNCEEACGPNRYGQTCNGICSWLETGCKGMIFCNVLNSCTCAAGLTGTDCTKECNAGTYGASCLNTCGRCSEEFCNVYTGECTACEKGYYPPLCHDRYVTLKQAPNVTEKNWFHVIISVNFTNIVGKGSPHLYEVQYKKKEDNEWIKSSCQEINARSVVLHKITNLEAGTSYLSRVVIISEDGNGYNGSDISVSEFETLCDVPDSNDYQIQSRNVTTSGFAIEWNYSVRSDKWCPINAYKVILQERWRRYIQNVSSENTNMVYSNLLPGHKYTTYICAKTSKGFASCSRPFAVSTAEKAPGKVRNLVLKSRNARDIQINWRQPSFTGGKVRGYRVHYQCVKLFICQDTCKNSSGYLETNETSAHLVKLLPHAQYKIRVVAYSASQGPYTEIFTTTKTTIPDTAPLMSEQPIISKTNSSVQVQWNPPKCFGRNGLLLGYYFTLSSYRESGLTILQNGTTENVQTDFTGLSPQTQYQVHIYACNSHGWNPEYKLIISFLSSATVPEAVQNLQVYKKGRRMLGIRWEKPIRVYGDLKTFTVTYQQKGTELKFNETVLPTHCSGWPHLFCYTIDTNLRSDKQYAITVKARNNEIDEDGVTSEVTAITRENAPDAPSTLSILRSTSTSFEMQWALPNMFNGEIRSFIVNVEHIDSINEAECCEYFPVQELPFREEMPFYNLEVSGLLPASKYIVSVAGKTITMGPSINATYYTAPLPPTDLRSPQVLSVAYDGDSCLIKIQPLASNLTINGTYLLLALPPEEKTAPVIWKRNISQKLASAVNHTYYIISEFPTDEFTSDQEVRIGTGGETRNGTLARMEDPKLNPGVYQVGLALVQAYGDAVSVGLALSNIFEVHVGPGHAGE